MKTLLKFALLSAITFGVITGCSKSKDENKSEEETHAKRMTMTTEAMDVALLLIGTGTATIGWGDGKPSETHTISDDWQVFQHSYSNASSHTITVAGDNITTLNCQYNQLKTLDVSKNTALADLDCYGNRLGSLDLKNNIALSQLHCGNNRLDIRMCTPDLLRVHPILDLC